MNGAGMQGSSAECNSLDGQIFVDCFDPELKGLAISRWVYLQALNNTARLLLIVCR